MCQCLFRSIQKTYTTSKLNAIYLHIYIFTDYFACPNHNVLCVIYYLPDDPEVENLDMSRHLQTGEILIIMTVLLMWAGKEQRKVFIFIYLYHTL